jgi:transposase-like protein
MEVGHGRAPDCDQRDAETAHKIGRKSARRPSIEVITRSDRRRTWTLDQKREIVAESLGLRLTPTEVVRKNATGSGQLYTWRQQVAWRADDAAVARNAALCTGGDDACATVAGRT